MSQKKSGLENLVLITQLGINVMTPILLCLFAGSWIDKKTGWNTILVFLILGVLSGGLSAYKMAKQTIDKEKELLEKEKEEKIKQWNDRFGTDGGSKKSKRKGW